MSVSPALWVSATTYGLGDIVSGSDSNLYASVAGTNVGHDPTTDGGVHWKAAAGGGSSAGSPIVRKFPFAFDTPGILTGAALYTPTVGDILLDAWIEIDTAWDGTTPKGDLGQFVTAIGLFGGNTSPLDMSVADNENGAGPGILDQTLAGITPTIQGTNVFLVQTSPPPTHVSAYRQLPGKFTAANPIKVCVSQDGTTTGANPGSTQGAAILYLITASPI